MTSIDLNAELGEGFGHWRLTDDERLLSVVTNHTRGPRCSHRARACGSSRFSRRGQGHDGPRALRRPGGRPDDRSGPRPPGHAHLGVPRSGALDGPAAALANRLVGNGPDAAVLETTLDGCSLRPRSDVTVAVTGAPCRVTVDGRPAAWGRRCGCGRGRAGRRARGAGGTGVCRRVRRGDRRAGAGKPVHGSVVRAGARAVDGRGGAAAGGAYGGARARGCGSAGGAAAELVLRVALGPRDDWFTAGAVRRFVSGCSRSRRRVIGSGCGRRGRCWSGLEGRSCRVRGWCGGGAGASGGDAGDLSRRSSDDRGYPVIGVVHAADLAGGGAGSAGDAGAVRRGAGAWGFLRFASPPPPLPVPSLGLRPRPLVGPGGPRPQTPDGLRSPCRALPSSPGDGLRGHSSGIPAPQAFEERGPGRSSETTPRRWGTGRGAEPETSPSGAEVWAGSGAPKPAPSALRSGVRG